MTEKILITGGAGGIATETIKQLKKDQDYELKALDNDGERLDKVEDVEKVNADVRDYEEMKEISRDMDIDILVNCAGYQKQGAAEDMEIEEYRKHIETNYLGAINCTKAFLKQIKSNKGKIINISSIAGRTGAPFLSAYTGSKYALEGFTDSFRKEMVGENIQVVLVEPGRVKTGFNEKGAKNTQKYVPESRWSEKYREISKGSYGGISSEKAGEKLAKIIKKDENKTRYTINKEADIIKIIKFLTPTKIYDKLVMKLL